MEGTRTPSSSAPQQYHHRLHLSVPEPLLDGPGSYRAPTECSEVASKQAEWDRNFATLDMEEVKLHQTQLRLLREQTTTFVRELAVLQDEVADMKHSRDSILVEFRADLDAHRREALEAHSAMSGGLTEDRLQVQRLSERFATLERDWTARWQDLEASCASSVDASASDLREDLARRDARLQAELDRRTERSRALAEQEREVVQGKLQDLVSLHAEAVARVQGVESQHGALGERTERLERELQSQLSKKCATLDREVRDLQANVAEERRAGEARTQRISALEVQRGAVMDLAAQHAQTLDRLADLERACAEAAEQQRSDGERITRKLEQLGHKVSDHHSQLSLQAGLPERVLQLEGQVGEAADRSQEELASVAAKLEPLLTRLTACERHGAALQELQRGASAEAAERGRLEEGLRRLEEALDDSSTTRSSEVESLRVVQARLEASCHRFAKDIDSVKANQAQNLGLADRVAGAERLVAEAADRNAQEILALQVRIDRVGGRLAPFEAQGQAVAELKRAQASLSATVSGLEAAQAGLQGRAEELEAGAKEAADSFARASEASRSQLELLQGRVERLQTSLGEVQQQQIQLQQQRSPKAASDAGGGGAASAAATAALEGQHVALRDRVDAFAQALGDSVDRLSHELETLRAERRDRSADELSGSTAAAAKTAAVEVRVACLERQTMDLDAELRALVAPLLSAVEEAASRAAACEQRMTSTAASGTAELRRAQAAQAAELSSLSVAQASLRDRVDSFDAALGDESERRARALEAAEVKIDRLVRAGEDQRAAQAQLSADLRACQAAVAAGRAVAAASFDEASPSAASASAASTEVRRELAALRLRLEGAVDGELVRLGASIAEHARAIGGLRADHARLAEERLASVEGGHAELSATVSRELSRLSSASAEGGVDRQALAALGERVGLVEATVRGLEDLVRQDAERLRASLREQREALGEEIADMSSTRSSKEAQIFERFTTLESSIREGTEETSLELAALRSAVTELQLAVEEARRSPPQPPSSTVVAGSGGGGSLASTALAPRPLNSSASAISVASSFASAAVRRTSPGRGGGGEPPQEPVLRSPNRPLPQPVAIGAAVGVAVRGGGSCSLPPGGGFSTASPPAPPPSVSIAPGKPVTAASLSSPLSPSAQQAAPPAPPPSLAVMPGAPLGVAAGAQLRSTQVLMQPVVQRMYSAVPVTTLTAPAITVPQTAPGPLVLTPSASLAGAGAGAASVISSVSSAGGGSTAAGMSLFDRMDKDNDGVVTREEFNRFMQQQQQQQQPQLSRPSRPSRPA